jgi:hypothetical protein
LSWWCVSTGAENARRHASRPLRAQDIDVYREAQTIGILTASALGAPPARLLAGVFARALGQIAAGALVGVTAALVLHRGLNLEMAGGWHIPGVLPAAVMFMLTIGLMAAAGPARRALRVNPTERCGKAPDRGRPNRRARVRERVLKVANTRLRNLERVTRLWTAEAAAGTTARTASECGQVRRRRARLRRRDVRSGDANRLRVERGRSCRRLAVEQPGATVATLHLRSDAGV